MGEQVNALERAKVAAGIGSDYALARRIGITRQYVSALHPDQAQIELPLGFRD